MQDALSIALTEWTKELKVGETTAWEQFAASAYVIRKVVATAPPEAQCRWIALREGHGARAAQRRPRVRGRGGQ